ncbi:hypothetical protein RI129_013222 [Pyrocoelia pectoralis]|uniref:Major facilitator superfamily (MFS) profile domain-containing protein n=1 Tax=Pyrocoelia pectoralis TaxID=417401 RepID=A0AAN7ZCW6_9COLE
MDAIGRLNLLRLVALPSVVGWLLLALATNVPMLICGRLLTGIALVWIANPGSVYLTEISRKDVRGSFTSTCSLGASIGMVLVYIKGWYLSWRVVAWINIGYTIAFTLLLFLIPESPAWLISKGRINQAKKSLEWFHKYQPQPENKVNKFCKTSV